MTETQLKTIIKEELLSELLTQKLQTLSLSALKVLIKTYTSHKDPELLVAGIADDKRKKERLIFILNDEVTAEARVKMEKEMSAWRWGWTRSANRAKSDAQLAGKKVKRGLE